jgi:hypothetical protein
VVPLRQVDMVVSRTEPIAPVLLQSKIQIFQRQVVF